MTSTYSRLVGIGYFIAAILFFFPVIDLVANGWPMAPGRVNWRYGAYVLLSGFVLTMLLGAALVILVGRAARHRRTVKILGVLSALGGVLILVAGVVFVLDAVQLRAGLAGEAQSQFGIGVGKALVKNAAAAVGFLWIGWVGFRKDRAMERSARAGSAPVVGGGAG